MERSTSREALSDDDVRELLTRVEDVVIARGPARRDLKASEAEPGDLKGPSGKYRAPMVMMEGTLYVGFGAAVLGDLAG